MNDPFPELPALIARANMAFGLGNDLIRYVTFAALRKEAVLVILAQMRHEIGGCQSEAARSLHALIDRAEAVLRDQPTTTTGAPHDPDPD